jgi:hypothetical protein
MFDKKTYQANEILQDEFVISAIRAIKENKTTALKNK